MSFLFAFFFPFIFKKKPPTDKTYQNVNFNLKIKNCIYEFSDNWSPNPKCLEF